MTERNRGGVAVADRRREILDTALAIADEGGIEAVSMRAVAQRVGVTAMALYPHFRGKEALLDGLVGRVLAELTLPDPAAPWRDRLRDLAHAARRLAHRHPAVAPLLFSRPAVTPDALRVVDAIYQALLDAGVPSDQVARIERMLSTFVLGYAVSEVGGRFGTATMGTREKRGQLPGLVLQAHNELPPWLDAPWSWEAEFDSDLADLVAVISTVAGAPSTGKAGR
jgi:AcrR family transcriptional regulator